MRSEQEMAAVFGEAPQVLWRMHSTVLSSCLVAHVMVKRNYF